MEQVCSFTDNNRPDINTEFHFGPIGNIALVSIPYHIVVGRPTDWVPSPSQSPPIGARTPPWGTSPLPCRDF